MSRAKTTKSHSKTCPWKPDPIYMLPPKPEGIYILLTPRAKPKVPQQSTIQCCGTPRHGVTVSTHYQTENE
jgi:hypothetical protein